MDVLIEQQCDMEAEDMTLFWLAFGEPGKLPELIAESRHNIQVDTVSIEVRVWQPVIFLLFSS